MAATVTGVRADSASEAAASLAGCHGHAVRNEFDPVAQLIDGPARRRPAEKSEKFFESIKLTTMTGWGEPARAPSS